MPFPQDPHPAAGAPHAAGRGWLAAGSLVALLAVAAGAFGAHALKTRLDPESLSIFEVAVRYQMYHALGIVAIGVLSHLRGSRMLAFSGWSFLIGILLFSGSLYVLALTGWKRLGMVTPLGGFAFLVGWGWLGWLFLLSRRDDAPE